MDKEPSPIPLLDIAAQHAPLGDALREAVLRVVDSGQYILGDEVSSFEREVAAHLGVPHALGVSSGTDALLAALMALEVGHGDEVITTPFSFFATAGCIARLGARPVFVDIEPATYNLDVSKVEAAISERTKAVMPVHIFGQLADMQPLQALCAARGIPIVEDAAQAVGARCGDVRVGHLSEIACFSFFPSKNLGCMGDGGLVTTQNDDLARRLRILRAHGSEPKYYHHVIGGNFRLDAVQAAVLRVKLPHLERWTEARRDNAARYDRWFSEAGLPPTRLTPPHRCCDGHVYNQYVIRTDVRDELKARLQAQRIGCEVYYPLPLHLQPCFAYLGQGPGTFPVAETSAEQVLALPIFGELGEARQRRIADVVIELLRSR